jgi:hypothetical protein
MMRVSPSEPNPTNHFLLKDRKGRELGLTICNESGEARPFHDERVYIKNPVETTAQKQTSGSSSYADYDYPYSPIVQDDISGGRGGSDFERDSTKFFDSYRCRSSRANKAYAGPLEQYATGIRNQDQTLPHSVRWVNLFGTQRYIYKRFQASANYTAGLAWLLTRCIGTPADLTVAIYADSAGNVGSLATSITVASTRMDDLLSEWLDETISQALTSGVYYWLVVYGGTGDSALKHWKVACNNSSGTTYASEAFDSTPTAQGYDLYFRLTDANTEKTCKMFEYKEQQYFVISGASGAPKIYMAGDRGTADANTGQLTKLIDATKTWTVNEWAGFAVQITDGLGKLEAQTWRTVVSNTANELVLSEGWTITHDTTTEYVILGTKLKEITGHGLTAPVTSVLVSTKGVIYFAMGDSVTVRGMREYTNAGDWTREYADETATTKAVLMVYKPGARKIVISNNSDVNGNVSVSHSSNVSGSDAIIPDWGTALTWATPVPVDSKYRKINGMIVHPDGSGTEAVWVFKTDVPFIVPGTGDPSPVSIDEMRTVRSDVNGLNPMRHGVYLYFPMLQGLERYYGGQFDDIGPNLGEGLPANRRGNVVAMVGYPGKFFTAVDAGSSKYSSVLDSGGWHERYRAPKGQRITAMAFQVTPGTNLDRLWLWQGNDLVWLPFPSNSTNELEDTNYPYAPEFAVTLSRMHAGMFDVQKLVKKIKLQTEALEVNDENGEPICWFELDYRLNQDTEWTTVPDIFTESPTQEVDFTKQYGVAGKRLQFRIRGYTTDASKTPVFLAIIISAVIRVDVKNFYGPFTFMIKDDERVGLRELDSAYTAEQKLKIFEDWGDASNDSMIKMSSASRMCDEKMIFVNVGTRRQIGFESTDGSPFKGNVYLVSATMQEA